ncbi:Detected protein of unknown function [Hibiscus syriacus]|uniref:Uncharacterized protein n=1 Tax=Hibiscus syriacus TaxID=106335 RepID=A0A6A3BS71_HIBSY|nr:Detected protein of unknown function [Hibiscus syriacus]
MKRDDRQFPTDGRTQSLIAIAGLIAGVILISSLIKAGDDSLLCSIAKSRSQPINAFSDIETELRALVHYAPRKEHRNRTSARSPSQDQKWVANVLKGEPDIRAYAVNYRTQLKEAGDLLKHYRTEPSCFPSNAYLRGNDRCKLALTGFPHEFYDTEWDLIMIDAPRGYFVEAPGRMTVIFSAAVMARNKKGFGVTHVFLHDVDRKWRSFSPPSACAKSTW